MPKVTSPAASTSASTTGQHATQPVTYGTYYQDALPDGSQITATLQTDGSDFDGGWYALEVDVPAKEGATRASLTVLLFNGDDAIYAVQTAGIYEDVPLGGPVLLEDHLAPLQANNPTWEANPVTSRVTIDSVYWYDADWELIAQHEGLDFWGWTAEA